MSLYHSVSRLGIFCNTRCITPSIRYMATSSQFKALTNESRHANRARDLIKDTVDQRLLNRSAASTPDHRWLERSKKALESVESSPPADTYSGRTVHVKAMGDLATAYKQLDRILSRNKVRATVRMDERHEKPGVKRRRLSSQRWRKRFADEVRKKVQLVMKICDRGA